MKSSEQLTLAQNEKTPETILIKLWDTSKSVRVRKAIAKNPNAGPKVLRSAARLYLEEVLENPGFFMLELFDEDAWIKNLSEAYSNPEEFIDGCWHRSVISKHQLGWACLLSPQLTSRAVNVIAQYVPSATCVQTLPGNLRRISLIVFFADSHWRARASPGARW